MTVPRYGGRMSPGLLAVVVAVAVACGAGAVWRWRGGRFRDRAVAVVVPEPPAVWGRLGVVAGTPVTLVQFSSAFCAPCRATRVLCADVAAAVPGVRHVEVDAESHLAEVRELGVWRTPTLLLVDAAGRERMRASGVPSRSQLMVAVGSVLAPVDGGPVASSA